MQELEGQVEPLQQLKTELEERKEASRQMKTAFDYLKGRAAKLEARVGEHTL